MKAKIWTDGSYNTAENICSAGVLIKPEIGDEIKYFVSTNNPLYTKNQSVGGEILGVISAMETAKAYGFTDIVINHDYMGLAHWITGIWKAKNDLTKFYKEMVFLLVGKQVKFDFMHVKAHNGDKYNELVDGIAKFGAKILKKGA